MNSCQEPIPILPDLFIYGYLIIHLPISDKLNQEFYWWNINPRNLWSERHKAPEPWVLTECLPLPADPGADGDQGLVRDVAQDVEQHLVWTLFHVTLIMDHHVVNISHMSLLCHTQVKWLTQLIQVKGTKLLIQQIHAQYTPIMKLLEIEQ